ADGDAHGWFLPKCCSGLHFIVVAPPGCFVFWSGCNSDLRRFVAAILRNRAHRMSSATSATENKKPAVIKSSKAGAALPPEEEFWKPYSPHHEFPLSSAGSFALHALVFVLIAIVGIWLLKDNDRKKPLQEIGIVVVGGGGGNPLAQGEGPGGELPRA